MAKKAVGTGLNIVVRERREFTADQAGVRKQWRQDFRAGRMIAAPGDLHGGDRLTVVTHTETRFNIGFVRQGLV